MRYYSKNNMEKGIGIFLTSVFLLSGFFSGYTTVALPDLAYTTKQTDHLLMPLELSPSTIDTLYSSNIPSTTCNYLIITHSSLEQAVSFLKNWKELIGYAVKIVNISWINSQYPGRDLPERIRNFLVENYVPWGIEYLLIVGSHDTIPMRYCCEPPTSDFAVPTDYYYADLTSNWDSDGDGIYAEFADDQWPDFSAEIWVGRIPTDSPEDVRKICQKTIAFEQNSGSWKNRALLIGAISNFQHEEGQDIEETDNAVLMEKIRNDILNPHDIETVTLYEKVGLSQSVYDCQYPLNHDNVLTQWKQGYGIVNWGSHGNSFASYRRWWATDDGDRIPELDEIRCENFILRSDTSALDDEKPSIVFSCSCNNADPKDPDNLGKSLLDHGAVAFIGATYKSVYFSGWENENDGGNMAINYFFFKELIESDNPCGVALYNAKYSSWENEEIPRVFKNMLIFCLYGDPSLSFTTYNSVPPPTTPATPQGQHSIKPYTFYSYTTTATDPQGREIYYLWDWGDGENNLMGPIESGKPVESSHQWKIPGDYQIRVKSIGFAGDESDWSEPLLIHVEGPILEVEEITSGLFKINAIIQNIGDSEATDIEWTIDIIGGSIILGKQSSGTIDQISTGEKQTLISKLIYGIGLPSIISVTVKLNDGNSINREVQANVIFFYIQIKP